MSAEEATGIARAAEQLRRATRLPLKVLLPTAIALGAGGTLAAAAIPGSGGVITACYNTQTNMADVYTYDQPASTTEVESDTPYPLYGSLRVIDPAAATVTETIPTNDGGTTTTVNAYVNACAPNEQTITWNQQGVPGINGKNGTNGTNGTNGSNGSNGSNGADGKAGQDGSIDGAATFEIDAGGGSELFAQLSQIAGSSKLDGQAGLISLESFAFGAESTVLSTSKGAGAGPAVQTFEFTKKDDKTDAELFQDWQQNKTIARLQVQAVHTTKSKVATDAATFTFADVKLKSIQQKDGQETVVGVFTKMQSSFGSGTSKVQGSLNPSGATSWDLTTQKTS